MNNTTFAFNGFLKSITEDINMISDPYNRARIKALVMQTLVATGSVEDQFIGVEGPVDTAASAKKPRRKKTDRQELENHPNEKPAAEADNNTANANTEIPTDNTVQNEPVQSAAAPAEPAQAEQVTQCPEPVTASPASQEGGIIMPEDIEDTWTDNMQVMFKNEIKEIMDIAKANIAAKKIDQAFMIQCAINATNGLVTNWRNPFDVPPRYIKIFLAEFKTRIVAANGILPAAA